MIQELLHPLTLLFGFLLLLGMLTFMNARIMNKMNPHIAKNKLSPGVLIGLLIMLASIVGLFSYASLTAAFIMIGIVLLIPIIF